MSKDNKYGIALTEPTAVTFNSAPYQRFRGKAIEADTEAQKLVKAFRTVSYAQVMKNIADRLAVLGLLDRIVAYARAEPGPENASRGADGEPGHRKLSAWQKKEGFYAQDERSE